MSQLRLPGIPKKRDDGSTQTGFNILTFLNSVFPIILHPPECRKRLNQVNTKEQAALITGKFCPLLDLVWLELPLQSSAKLSWLVKFHTLTVHKTAMSNLAVCSILISRVFLFSLIHCTVKHYSTLLRKNAFQLYQVI